MIFKFKPESETPWPLSEDDTHHHLNMHRRFLISGEGAATGRLDQYTAKFYWGSMTNNPKWMVALHTAKQLFKEGTELSWIELTVPFILKIAKDGVMVTRDRKPVDLSKLTQADIKHLYFYSPNPIKLD